MGAQARLGGEMASTCRFCTQNPFSFLQFLTGAQEQTKSKRDPTAFVSRTETEVTEVCEKWVQYVHPRAREFFGMGQSGMLQAVLSQIARNVNRTQNPIPGGSECIYWFGETTENDRHAVITMVKPGDDHESVTYVSRVLVFLFATDASFEKLMQLPKEPFKTVCQDPLCINLNHISAAV